jgi:hypothetical protein
VLQRHVRGRVQFTNSDRLFFLQLYRWFPSIMEVMTSIRPETLVRWHRAGFRRYWRWKSRNLGGRPPIDLGLQALIRRMSIENMLWGVPRIQGELFRLGFAVAQSTVAKYMAVVFQSREASKAERSSYRIAVAQTLKRCAFLPFTEALGSTLAGQPLTMTFVDDRQQTPDLPPSLN